MSMIEGPETSQPRISVIIPTIGRATLRRSLESLISGGISLQDELIVVADGQIPEALKIVDDYRDRINIKYFEIGPTRWNGVAQFRHGIEVATGTHLAFLGDDDAYDKAAINIIRETASKNPGKPLMFRAWIRDGRIIWDKKILGDPHTCGVIFVPPNNKSKLGQWGNSYFGEHDFARETIDKYPNKEADIVWDEHMIAYCY